MTSKKSHTITGCVSFAKNHTTRCNFAGIWCKPDERVPKSEKEA